MFRCVERRSDVKGAYRFASEFREHRNFFRKIDINEMVKLCQRSIFIKVEFGLPSEFQKDLTFIFIQLFYYRI